MYSAAGFRSHKGNPRLSVPEAACGDARLIARGNPRLTGITYSIVIPAYNEGERLENPGNRGKGYSVRNGMLKARGEAVVFSDPDLSRPLKKCRSCSRRWRQGRNIAIGSRWLRAELQTRRQSPHRQLLGRIFNLLLRIVLGLRFKDTQCGFKAFTRRTAQTILPLPHIERWGFDPEILFLARKFGFRVGEVTVLWGHSGETRIHPLVDGARMFQEMLRIRWYDLTGKGDGGSAVGAQPAKPLPGRSAPRF